MFNILINECPDSCFIPSVYPSPLQERSHRIPPYKNRIHPLHFKDMTHSEQRNICACFTKGTLIFDNETLTFLTDVTDEWEYCFLAKGPRDQNRREKKVASRPTVRTRSARALSTTAPIPCSALRSFMLPEPRTATALPLPTPCSFTARSICPLTATVSLSF